MAIRQLSTASIKTGSKSNKLWNQDTQQGAMVPIATIFGTGTAGEISFTSIPQIYQDLMVVLNVVTANATYGFPYFYVNTYGSPSPSWTRVYGTGAAIVSDRASTSTSGSVTHWGYRIIDQTPGAGVIHILDYANTSKFKTILSRGAGDANGSGSVSMTVTTHASTSGITSLNAASFAAGCNYSGASSFTLYGIKAGV